MEYLQSFSPEMLQQNPVFRKVQEKQPSLSQPAQPLATQLSILSGATQTFSIKLSKALRQRSSGYDSLSKNIQSLPKEKDSEEGESEWGESENDFTVDNAIKNIKEKVKYVAKSYPVNGRRDVEDLVNELKNNNTLTDSRLQKVVDWYQTILSKFLVGNEPEMQKINELRQTLEINAPYIEEYKGDVEDVTQVNAYLEQLENIQKLYPAGQTYAFFVKTDMEKKLDNFQNKMVSKNNPLNVTAKMAATTRLKKIREHFKLQSFKPQISPKPNLDQSDRNKSDSSLTRFTKKTSFKPEKLHQEWFGTVPSPQLIAQTLSNPTFDFKQLSINDIATIFNNRSFVKYVTSDDSNIDLDDVKFRIKNGIQEALDNLIAWDESKAYFYKKSLNQLNL